MKGNGAGHTPVEGESPAAPWQAPVDQQVAAIEERLVGVRRHLHMHPEPSCEEYETSRYLAEQLEQAGIRTRLLRDGLGVIGDFDLGHVTETTPRIALRADIDALQIQDAKRTPYASRKSGLCHACGHDAHATMILGAALAASEMHKSGRLPGGDFGVRLRFLFQPAEEESLGARWLVEQGAVDDVDAILAQHVDPERTLGTVGIRYGVLTANCDEVELIVEGSGGHAARPHHTRDPIAAAAHLISALYQFLPRSVDARDPVVFTVGKVAGGTLSNVIPDRVEIQGSLRTLQAETRTRVHDRIEEIVHGVKEASGTTIHLRFPTSIDGVNNDRRCTAALEAASREVLGDEAIQPVELPSMGAEDFAAYLDRVPGAMLRLGCAPPGFTAPFLHAPDFDVDERVLAIGTRIMLRAALRLADGSGDFSGGAGI
ncbi:MAG: amidohydrolase [Planctomycetota bacterium]|nr:MAG: amidohydrolase [Planctomycetota bacterium]REJ97071.1 MAG: amidohydrolase [Planctomycetota bacterium]REK20578.1 MAG: amidohydrolase [Planctomycetota bacterium]REK35097.1 MAG: amidohydrolase [Planctomycetota bacterium]